MNAINIKQIKRTCSVRGCKNKVSFNLTRIREFGNSVLICRECLEDALDAIDKLAENNDDESTANDPIQINYTCEQCGKTYGSKSALTRHKKVCDL